MNKHQNTEYVEIDATEFLGGNYLKKEDVQGEQTVTLMAVRAEQMPNSTRRKLVCEFREFEKPLILNKTNIKRLANIFKSRDAATWRGAITLDFDENVEYAGTLVGGIRVKEATPNGGGTQAPQGEGVDFF